MYLFHKWTHDNGDLMLKFLWWYLNAHCIDDVDNDDNDDDWIKGKSI